MDQHGNLIALEGCDRCFCGCKYWENDICVDCETHVSQLNTLLTDTIGDSYGVFANDDDARAEAKRLGLGAYYLDRTDAPVNEGNEKCF